MRCNETVAFKPQERSHKEEQRVPQADENLGAVTEEKVIAEDSVITKEIEEEGEIRKWVH